MQFGWNLTMQRLFKIKIRTLMNHHSFLTYSIWWIKFFHIFVTHDLTHDTSSEVAWWYVQIWNGSNQNCRHYRADTGCGTDGRTDRQTSLSMNKPTKWYKSGRVSLVTSSCLYKSQPKRTLAQLCHTRIDALSPDKYQFHLLLHRNSHHSQATYPKWLNH